MASSLPTPDGSPDQIAATTVPDSTRHVAFERGRGRWAIRDRRNGSIVYDWLTRSEAHEIVWDKNGQRGARPRRLRRG